ncbi:MAG: hypothetical protein EHJ94_06780 [Deltaproteobacteria bacterium]|nr:MAG: hypothetical protein EHJ94_06780 [Deltaproteobacteria bacterium]
MVIKKSILLNGIDLYSNYGYTASPMIRSRHPGPRYQTGSCLIPEDAIARSAYFAPRLMAFLYNRIADRSTVTYRISPETGPGETLFSKKNAFDVIFYLTRVFAKKLIFGVES